MSNDHNEELVKLAEKLAKLAGEEITRAIRTHFGPLRKRLATLEPLEAFFTLLALMEVTVKRFPLDQQQGMREAARGTLEERNQGRVN